MSFRSIPSAAWEAAVFPRPEPLTARDSNPHTGAATEATLAWRCLAVGVPPTLLLDLAAGPALDSAALLHDEQVTALAATAWAAAGEKAQSA
jgi:hypothetical protein